MAGLVFFWSLAAFVVLLAALFFRPAAGNVTSPLRRRAFAAVLGTATTGLAVLAATIQEQEIHAGAVVLAALAGALFAGFVSAQLAGPSARAARFFPRAGIALLVLGVVIPFVAFGASWPHPVPPASFPRPGGIVAPSLGEVILYARGTDCGASWVDRNVSAHLRCAPEREPALDREWVITTELREGTEPPLYLVRRCVVGEAQRVPSPCIYVVQPTPPVDTKLEPAPVYGVSVPPGASLVATFEPVHARWAIETVVHGGAEEPGLTMLIDARSLDIAAALDVEEARQLPFPPAPWALLLALWAVGAALALRAHRAATRQRAQLATARPAELRDGLLHVEGETAPRQLVVGPRDLIQHHRGPVVWNPSPRASERELAPYRRSRLALAADLAPGELAEHRERATAAANRSFAVFAALVGAGVLPVLVAAVGHLVNPEPPLHFHPQWVDAGFHLTRTSSSWT